MIKIALICGGPSAERGVSLNSARSFVDHVQPLNIQLTILYMDPHQQFHLLSLQQIYSNTPSDFDFKLTQTSVELSEEAFLSFLKQQDLTFSTIHGAYGEDGQLQAFLEAHQIPYVGSDSQVCRTIFDKYASRIRLQQLGYPTLPFLKLPTEQALLTSFWKEHISQKAVIKPTMSGSSIGVQVVHTIQELEQAITSLQSQGFRDLLLEPYCKERELTICVVENRERIPVSLPPLEIEVRGEPGTIFDYRKKYLPSDQTRYHCPPDLPHATLQRIQKEAEQLFNDLKLRDFARLDAWLKADGTLFFSDFNPLSGLEQNSFIFQQAARIGLSHTDLIQYILQNALLRTGSPKQLKRKSEKAEKQKPVFVLMGGITSERQVSLLSGTNVWLKLLQSPHYSPEPFLLSSEETVWQLPYAFTLHHTTEEMVEHCQKAPLLLERALPLANEIRLQLGLSRIERLPSPTSMHLKEWLKLAQKTGAFVFNALHGGLGEDGTLQRHFQEHSLSYNGSDQQGARLGMDKYQTANAIASLQDPFVLPMQQASFSSTKLCRLSLEEIETLWQNLRAQWNCKDLLIKPQCDGCSTGVVRLQNVSDLAAYLDCLQKELPQAPVGTFTQQLYPIEMPFVQSDTSFLIEPFIETDRIEIQGTQLHYERISGWCEMTIGVLESKGTYSALNPSITVAKSHVLSVEEKFQGGTGVNITPPPEWLLSLEARHQVKTAACRAASALMIKNYARLDLFVEWKTGVIRVIEVNTLPALTPSTVLYHQALSEASPLFPSDFLSHLIQNAEQSS